MYVGGRPYSILKIAGAKVKVQWELDESYKKCQRHAGDQMVAQGAGVRSARGALGASWIMSDGGARQPRITSDGGAKQPRITSDGGAKQPRYGIRFKRTGQASGAHVARYVHLGSHLMAGPSSPGTGSDSSTRGGCPQRTWRVGCILAAPVRDQIQAHGEGIGSARGALGASGIMYDGGPGMQSHHTHRNFLFGMVHLPPSGGTRWVII
ncbi:hypothetical protein B0H17DRAFT_1149273 [Mycena rosella]|uniref:Uncharacterized protein n=1 Tax=Mycena rosella TaxID=1033263 RepID=A0AAD7C339_MYCRO|nr:hypothetical protein B0H17DRAFT_1149273 [Mycena rosella]